MCFVSGGYGAPAEVDTRETVRALGVKRVLLADMHVGDLLMPEAILCEERISFYYI